jgi:hypothetical protein
MNLIIITDIDYAGAAPIPDENKGVKSPISS